MPYRRFYASVVLTGCIAFAIPFAGRTAEVNTPADVRSVTAFATSKGFCQVKKDARTADCSKQTTICDARKWEAYINSNVEFVGGTPQKRTTVTTGGMMGFGTGSVVSGEELPGEVYAFLRKSEENRRIIPPLNEAACYCECSEGSNESACEGKPAGTPFRIGSDLLTREECSALCSRSSSGLAGKCAGTLPSLVQADATTAAGQAALAASSQSADMLIMCFTQGECLDQKGTWETYSQCPGERGRCLAPDVSVPLNTAIGSVTQITGFGNYVIIVFRYMLSIVVFLTTVMFIWGAFRYLTGSGLGNIGRGQAIMKDAVIGMILLLCSVVILRTINPATLKMNQIKMYMVNTQQFTAAQFCKDLSSGTKLADAGVAPSLRDRAEVEKNVAAYSEVPKTAECGHSYYIKDSSAGVCQGLVCDQPNEVCVSCVTGTPIACLNQRSNKKVCDKQIFAGSIEYQNERYPEQVYLVGVCGYAQTDAYGASALSIINSNLSVAAEIDLAKLRRQVGGTATDENVAGDAMYSFNLDAGDIQSALNACPNGFRGFLLGVQYNDGDVAFDDIALLSKQNCAGGSTMFDGYASGGAIDKDDLGMAFLCGLRKAPARFLDAQEVYWKREELEAAVSGRSAISCNFNLSDKNAPSDPGGKDPYCPAAATKAQNVNSTPACAEGVKGGNDCDTSKGGQACSLNGKICKCTPVGVAGTMVTSMWKCE